MQKQAENQVMYMGSLVIKDAFDVAKPRLVAEVLLHSGVNRRTAAALLKDMKALRRVAESEACVTPFRFSIAFVIAALKHPSCGCNWRNFCLDSRHIMQSWRQDCSCLGTCASICSCQWCRGGTIVCVVYMATNAISDMLRQKESPARSRRKVVRKDQLHYSRSQHIWVVHLKILIRESLFYVKKENWDQTRRQFLHGHLIPKKKIRKERVHREELSKSVRLMSVVLARQNSGKDRMRRP